MCHPRAEERALRGQMSPTARSMSTWCPANRTEKSLADVLTFHPRCNEPISPTHYAPRWLEAAKVAPFPTPASGPIGLRARRQRIAQLDAERTQMFRQRV
jgi:hypothetical protein